MGRTPGCSWERLHRGAWTIEEDSVLINYINAHGPGRWGSLPKRAGLERSGKSCRLRWVNYLRSDIKRGNISPEEEELIIRMHRLLGSRWALIAGRLPGRTGHEIRNYWNSHTFKKHTLENRIVNDESLCFDNMKETVLNKTAVEISSPSPLKPTAVRPREAPVTDYHSDQFVQYLLNVDSVDLDTSNLLLDFLPPLPPTEFSTDFSIDDCEIKDSMVIINCKK